jgi:hypothetical protein
MSARQGQNEFSLQLYRVYRGYNPHNLLDTVRSVPGAMQSPRNPYKLFVSRIRSPITRRNYEKWLERFFEFIKLEGETLEQQCILFVKACKDENCVLDYLDFIRQRVDKREITGASAKVYIIVVKLFCDTNKINRIEWKWLMAGLPRGSRSADDRPPTLEELRKIIEYPDRRIPAIITTMSSGGI